MPKPKLRNTALIQAWVPPAVRAALVRQASAEGISLADLLRRWAIEQAKKGRAT